MDKISIKVIYKFMKCVVNFLQFPALLNKNLSVIEETACKGMYRQGMAGTNTHLSLPLIQICTIIK